MNKDVRYSYPVTAAGMSRVNSIPTYETLYHLTTLLVPPSSLRHTMSGSSATRSLQGQNMHMQSKETNLTVSCLNTMEIGSCVYSFSDVRQRDFLRRDR